MLYTPGTSLGTTTTSDGIPAIRFACTEHSTGCPLVSDGETVYYVQVVDKDTIRLALAPTIAIHYDPPPTPPVTTPIHTIGRLDTSVFDSALVSGSTIGIPAQPFAPGTVVRYLGSPAIPSGVVDPSWTRTITAVSGTLITITGHGWTGDFGVIYTGASAPNDKLVGGQPYIVHVVDPNHIVLRELIDGVLTDVALTRPPTGISIELTSYRGLIGLDQGAAYKVVVVDSAHITLTTLDGVPVTIFWRGVGTHMFLFEKDIASFDPVSAVSSTSDTITFATPHGFKTGDAVIYRTADLTHQAPMPPAQFTDGLVATSATALTLPADRTALLVAGAQVTGIVDGVAFATAIVSASYDDTTKLTTLVLADPVLAVGKPITGIIVQLLDPVTFTPLERTVYDTPVSGLQDAYLYYVVKVDDFTIRLVTSAAAAPLAAALDLIEGNDSHVNLGTAHTLSTTGCLTGICISSSLTATNGIAAAATISDPTSKKVSVVSGLSGGFGSLEELFNVGKTITRPSIRHACHCS